jgi:hypothetical protein
VILPARFAPRILMRCAQLLWGIALRATPEAMRREDAPRRLNWRKLGGVAGMLQSSAV